MRTLAERDVTGLLSVVEEMTILDSVRPFPPGLLRHLGDLLGGADVFYNEEDRLLERSIFEASSAGHESATPSEERGRAYHRLVGQHPVCSRRMRSGDWTSVLKVSDFASQRSFEKTELWNELYRDDGVRYWMDVGIAPSGLLTRVFIFTRRGRDFDERDRLMLELLQPHLQRRYDQSTAAAEAVDSLAALEEGGTDDLHDVVLCSNTGVMEFASPHARGLLATYFGPQKGKLPEGLRAALRESRDTVSIERDGQRLTVRAARSAGMLLLLLGERDGRLDRLTPRQLEILEHVASGATDAAVGAALGVAPTTVKKHLEQIYERLGVHTRTAATALFLSRH